MVSHEFAGTRRQRDGVSGFGLSADRQFGRLETALTASWLSEDRTVLGATLFGLNEAGHYVQGFIADHGGVSQRLIERTLEFVLG